MTPGSRKAQTPLLTASTPVIAVQPLAKDRISSHALAAVVAVGMTGGACTGSGVPPASTAFTVPIASTANREATNRYVGTTNAKPDSRTPRRLTIVISVRIAKQSDS